MIAVNDAWRLLPGAEILYACDTAWWNAHRGAPGFKGERWSSHGAAARVRHNDKTLPAERYGLKLIEGRDGEGFNLDGDCIHYGGNSGFQAVNLALLFGARIVILVGFDMGSTDGKRHFFGDHPGGLRNTASFAGFIRHFDKAAKLLPSGLQIINATTHTALTCFPRMKLDDALSLADGGFRAGHLAATS